MKNNISLKDAVQKEITYLDNHFGKENDDPQLLGSWAIVREAALSFLDIFEKVNKDQNSRT